MAQQLDLPKELWTLANIITGFAVVQNIAFGYALAKDLAGLQTGPLKFKLLIAIIALVFAAVTVSLFGVARRWRWLSLLPRSQFGERSRSVG